jgi:hypothetical protein
MRDNDDDFDERGLLKDGHRFRVPIKMMDAIQRSVARHFQRRQHPQDSAAFPRPERRTFVTAADGGTMGLHRPGWRLPAGGHVGDKALRDSYADESERARDLYIYDITNAWKRPDTMTEDNAEMEARASAIRNALLSRGHSPDEVEDYLDDLDDDDILDGDIGGHIAAFEERLKDRDTRALALDRRTRLDELYRQRDVELSQQWRRR